MASLEFNLTLLIGEYLEVGSYHAEFQEWFIRVPVPFMWKVRLIDSMLRHSYLYEEQGNIGDKLRECQNFRNTLAHSFRSPGGSMTARGASIPAEEVTYEALKDRLEVLRNLENLVGGLLYTQIQGSIPPFSADDFADWPA